MKLIFKLTNPANRSGGDRYEAEMKGEERPFAIYFPQSISRKKDKPRETITVEVK